MTGQRLLLFLWLLALERPGARSSTAPPSACFGIEIVDDQTLRGVPMVELQTTSGARYYTDSAGWVAFYEPGLMNKKVWFGISAHGYEFPPDGFGIRGVALAAEPGTTARLKIKRINIAERLYRITGQGLYRDTTSFFDQEGGRIIYLEGSYVNTFSGNTHPTPYYEYNQILYRLDLADPRLRLPAPASAAGVRK